MEIKRNITIALCAVALGLSGCRKNPIERLINPVPSGQVPGSSGIYTIFDDELKTAGGLAFIPESGGLLIDLNDQTSPRRSTSQMRFKWDGQNVGSQHLVGGFEIIVSPDGSTLSTTPGKDLSSFGYTKLTFYLRGTLGTNTKLRIEGPTDTVITAARTELDSSQVTGDWQKITLSIPTSSDFQNVKVFAIFSFQYTQPPHTTNPGDGGEIFLDDIRYE